MNDNATPVELLLESAENYSNTTIELFKLNAINKSSDVISSLFSHLVVLLVIALFVLIITIGLSLWIGELLGKSFYGFFIIGSLYGVIAILLHYFSPQWIKKPIRNFIIIQMLKPKAS